MVIKKNIVQISILTTFGCFSWFKFSQPYPCILSLFSSTLFPQGHVLSCALIHVSFNSPCRLVFWVLAVYLVVLLMKRGCGTFRKYGLVEESWASESSTGPLGSCCTLAPGLLWGVPHLACILVAMHSCCCSFLRSCITLYAFSAKDWKSLKEWVIVPTWTVANIIFCSLSFFT